MIHISELISPEAAQSTCSWQSLARRVNSRMSSPSVLIVSVPISSVPLRLVIHISPYHVCSLY